MTENPVRLRTPLTDLVGTRYPIVQAGMSWVSSDWRLPVAVSRAGGLGVVAAGPMRRPDLARTLQEIRERTSEPWAVNLPLYRKGADEVIEDLLAAPPPVLIASQGGPRRYLPAFHDVGTRCLHVVASLEHAEKAAAAGVDGLVVVGAEAGGHPPPGGVSTLVLTRQVAMALPEVPVISSGGFADGAGLAAAIALGASGAQFGTRFIATHEANIHPDYRDAVVAARAEDTVTVGRGLGPVRILRNDFAERMLELESGGAAEEKRRLLFTSTVLREAAVDGRIADGKVEAGQSVGLIDGVLGAGEVVEAIVAEFTRSVLRSARVLGASSVEPAND